MDDWRLWRQDMFQLKDTSYEHRPYFCPRFDLADDLDYRYNREWGAECALTHYVDIPRMQDHLRAMHMRTLEFKELVPMVSRSLLEWSSPFLNLWFRV